MLRLIEIIEWTNAGRDTLSYRFPDEDHLIMRGAQLIVRESQTAQFMYLGQFADTFGPGKHRLVTDNIPILNHLKGWKYGFESPFKADLYFVATRTFTGNEWGTSNPVMLHDADLGIVRVRAFGTYDFHIADVPRFLREVAGTDDQYSLSQFSGAMRSRVVSAFSDALATSNIPVLSVASRYGEIGQALLPLINATLHDKYGIEMTSLVVENVSVPPEVEAAIDKRSTLTAIGNLNDYVKMQIGQGVGAGSAGLAGVGAELAAGLSLGQQLAGQAGFGAAALDVLTPAQVAAVLKVSEADVIASLESGDLKGKRIGSEWRVARGAVDAFMR